MNPTPTKLVRKSRIPDGIASRLGILVGQGKGLVTAVIEKYVQAGITVYCQGTPIVESYEKDGTKMTAFKLLAGAGSTFRLIGGKKGRNPPQTTNPPVT